MNIEDQTILVTGANSGLGAACVEFLIEGGANVIGLDLAISEDAKYPSDRCFMAKANVVDPEQVAAAIREGQAAVGALRGAILCAGIIHSQRVVGREGAASLDAFRRVIEVNLIGTFNVVRLAAEAMSSAEPNELGERGVIVMTSSIAAYDGQTGQSSYAASKGGVASMALPLARDLAKQGIRVVSIAPGVFETPMMSVAPDAIREGLVSQTAFPSRFGEPREFAKMAEAVFENTMLNGCVVRLDAGLRMPIK